MEKVNENLSKMLKNTFKILKYTLRQSIVTTKILEGCIERIIINQQKLEEYFKKTF